MQNKKTTKCYTLTMASPQQIATMRYPGCSTPQAVKNFCTRYSVNRFWWKPTNSTTKVMMIDVQNFRDCWNQKMGTTPTMFTTRKTSTTYLPKTSTSRSTSLRNKKTTTTKLSTKTGWNKTNRTTSRTRNVTTGRTYKTTPTRKTRRAA